MHQDPISKVVTDMEAERSASAEVNVVTVVHRLTDDLGGTRSGDEGVIACSVFLPSPGPDPWNLTISAFFDYAVWFNLERDGSGPGPRIYYGPSFDTPGTSDPSDTCKLPGIEELKTMLREWISDVREAETFYEAERRRSEQTLSIWAEAQPIQGTPAEAYLRQLGTPSWLPLPDTLRYHPECWHPSGPPRPAMVALLTDDLHRVYPDHELEPGEVPPFPMVHMTYLPEEGTSGDADKAEEFLLGSAGSAVEIVKQPLEAKAPILVAESIPTALALAAGIGRLLPHPARIWATLSPEGTAKLRLPAGREPPMPGYGTVWRVQDPRWVIIAADGSAESRQAAQDLADRARIFFRVDLLNAPEGQTWTEVRTDMGQRWGFGDRGCVSWTLEVTDHPKLGPLYKAMSAPVAGEGLAWGAEPTPDMEDIAF